MIYINGRFLSQKVTGLQRYAIEVVRAIDKLAADIKIKLVIPPTTDQGIALTNIEVIKTMAGKGHFWEQCILPLYVKNNILINFAMSAPFNTRNIMTVHDLAEFREPGWYSKKFLIYYKTIRPLLIKRAVGIITGSDFSKREIVDLLKVDESKINVIYEGKEHISSIQADNSIIRKLNLDNYNFVLSVGSLNSRKNFQRLIDAYLRLKPSNGKLVIVGGKNKKAFAGNMNFKHNADIIFAGYISDEQLKALYINAALFVYPSLYEGCGLPPLEAMACNCPVVVSDIPSLREICQNAVFYVDPYSIESISNGIYRVLSEKKLRDELIMAGQKRIELFSWNNAAHDFLKVLKRYN